MEVAKRLYMNIRQRKIVEIIKREYGIAIFGIEKLFLGFDHNTTVYKIFAKNDKTYFLKIRFENFTESSLVMPLLISQSINTSKIINVIKTIDGKLFVKVSAQYLMLYPFINGKSGWDTGLTKEQFVEFGEFMSQLHSVKIPEEYKKIIPTEQFDSKYRKQIKYYLNGTNENAINGDAIVIDFLNTFYKNKNTISKILDRLEEVSNKINAKAIDLCLCHGDIHVGNILIEQNKLYIVDWDTIILAPKERDLMFIGGGIGNKWNKKEDIDNFYLGYGNEIKANNILLRYYRLERIIQDIYEFYEQVVNSKTEEGEKKLCIKYFKEQFEVNNVIDIALAT